MDRELPHECELPSCCKGARLVCCSRNKTFSLWLVHPTCADAAPYTAQQGKQLPALSVSTTSTAPHLAPAWQVVPGRFHRLQLSPTSPYATSLPGKAHQAAPVIGNSRATGHPRSIVACDGTEHASFLWATQACSFHASAPTQRHPQRMVSISHGLPTTGSLADTHWPCMHCKQCTRACFSAVLLQATVRIHQR